MSEATNFNKLKIRNKNNILDKAKMSDFSNLILAAQEAMWDPWGLTPPAKRERERGNLARAGLGNAGAPVTSDH